MITISLPWYVFLGLGVMLFLLGMWIATFVSVCRLIRAMLQRGSNYGN